ncbi:MAG: hypothetical protein JJT96_14460 [Opitutales bacterium]|nr:hypothetical protein [Opitutales bacterium]
MSAIHSSVCAGLIALAMPTISSALIVDWLVLEAGHTSSTFALADDNGVTRANGTLSFSNGLPFPGRPTPFLLSSENFADSTGLTDTVTGDSTLPALEFRILPIDESEPLSYDIVLEVTPGRSFVIALGGLLRDSNGEATETVLLNAFSDTGFAAITLLGTSAWDDGEFNRFVGPLEWIPHVPVLNPAADNLGDSQIAFVQVDPLIGSNPIISLSFANGYNIGFGDPIILGVGMVIPEPKTYALLFGLAALLTAAFRRR